jgi:hypothetical protein
MQIPKWGLVELTGYEPKTTFWQDFSIADKSGMDAIKDTYNRVFNEWHKDYIYMTELALVINWKCWEHWHRGRKEMEQFLSNHNEVSDWYKETYYNLLDWADKNLKKKELQYFYKTLD